MSEWKTYKIKEFAEVVGGGTPNTTISEYWNGNISWITPRDLTGYRKTYISSGERKITEVGLKNSSSKLLPRGSVLITSRAPIGYVAIAEQEVCTNQGFKSLIINEKIANNLFIYYWVVNNTDFLNQMGTGTTFAEISGSVVKEIEIVLPPHEEQKAIASVLSSLDDKIDLLHRQNETLEKMAETLFRKWFVEDAKEDWEVGKLDDVLTTKGGTTPSTTNHKFWNGDIHWTSPRDITTLNGIFLFDTERKITREGLSKISSGLLPKGTLLMSSRAPVGVLAFSEVEVAINQGYIAIIDDKDFSKEFIYLWLKINMDYVQSFANGSTFQEISKSAFKSIEIQLIPKNIRKEFDKLIMPLFGKIKTNQIQIQTLTKLRDTLLPKLMSGEVRVKLD
jgi:type I restriction enzyme S subunit